MRRSGAPLTAARPPLLLALTLCTSWVIAGCSDDAGPTADAAPPADSAPLADAAPATEARPPDGPGPEGGPAVDSAPDDAGFPDGLPFLKHYLSFNESLCPAITSGAKTITLRNGHRSYIVEGEWIRLICSTSKTTFKARVTTVRLTTWGGITPQEYTDDGFSSQAEMMQVMQKYYPGVTLQDEATVYRWESTQPLP